MKFDKFAFMVKVLVSYRSIDWQATRKIKKEKHSIKLRYRELIRDMDFLSAWIQAKKEWLESYLSSKLLKKD